VEARERAPYDRELVLELFKDAGAQGLTDNELFTAWREAFPDRPKADGTLRARRVGLAWCYPRWHDSERCTPENYPSGCPFGGSIKKTLITREGGAVWRIRCKT
jgi:hypothetical protein